MRDLGSEYGTTTGRPRRVGWLDLPLLKYTIMMNDVDSLAIKDLLCAIIELGQFNVINNDYRLGKNILFEGAQGGMLDIDFGIYPFVTSSSLLGK